MGDFFVYRTHPVGRWRGGHIVIGRRQVLDQGIEQVEAEEQEKRLRDSHFNPWRIPRTERARAVVAEVLQQLQAYEERSQLRQRSRRKVDQETFEATVSAIVSDLTYHHLMEREAGVYITRSNRYLGLKGRYQPKAYSKTLPDILDRLGSQELAFLDMELGTDCPFGPPLETSIQAGSRLLAFVQEHDLQPEDFGQDHAQEVIQLKRAKLGGWDKGDFAEYEDTPGTILYREQVQAINAWLESAEIEFDEYYWPAGRPVDTLDRRLRRVFTQGSFDSGGRLFGGFWQPLGKEARRKGLMIKGEDVVELDYGQMNPRILYGLCGAQPPDGDAYDIPGIKHSRSGVKKVMNAMFFHDKRLVRMPKGVRKFFEERYTVEEVMRAIEAAHPAIKDSFFTGIGHQAQFIESQVMVEVLLNLRELGVHALPVHDSVIVGKTNQDKVREVMLSCFLRGTGVPGIVGVVGG